MSCLHCSVSQQIIMISSLEGEEVSILRECGTMHHSPPSSLSNLAVLSNSQYNVYFLRLESTAIRLMSFSFIELLVATLVNVASGWNAMAMAVKKSETGSLRLTELNYFYRRFMCLSVSIRSCQWNETWALLVFDYSGHFLTLLRTFVLGV